MILFTESTLCVGDHVSWHCPLDNSESRVQHMLMGEDPELGNVDTPNGPVQFVQIVGVTTEELRAAQHWNGLGVIDIMKRLPGCVYCSVFYIVALVVSFVLSATPETEGNGQGI